MSHELTSGRGGAPAAGNAGDFEPRPAPGVEATETRYGNDFASLPVMSEVTLRPDGLPARLKPWIATDRTRGWGRSVARAGNRARWAVDAEFIGLPTAPGTHPEKEASVKYAAYLARCAGCPGRPCRRRRHGPPEFPAERNSPSCRRIGEVDRRPTSSVRARLGWRPMAPRSTRARSVRARRHGRDRTGACCLHAAGRSARTSEG